MTTAVRHLFVYGLLKSGSTNGHGEPERARLNREATLLGPASIRGQLYDLGSFPGLVDSDDGRDLVHGEVYLLRTPAETFLWLDDYEDYFAHDLARSLYAREMRPVLLSTREALKAWVYVYVSSREAATRIASGRWTCSV